MTASIKHSLGNTKNWFRYYWKTLAVALFLICVLSGCCIVYAAGPTSGKSSEVIKGLGILNGMMDSVFNTTRTDDIAKTLGVSISSDFQKAFIYGKTLTGLGSFIGTIHNGCVAIAVCVICITFFSSLMSIRAVDITEEMMIRKFLLFIFSLVLCAYSHLIVANICNIGTKLLYEVANNYASSVTESTEAEDAINDDDGIIAKVKLAIYYSCNTSKYSKQDVIDAGVSDFLDINSFEDNAATMNLWDKAGHIAKDIASPVGYFLSLLLPWVISLFTGFILYGTALGRAIEILLMCAFSPLVFMDMTSLEDFSHSSAFRWLKTVGAVAIQGIVILGVVIVGSALGTSMLLEIAGNGKEFMGNPLAVTGNLCILLFAEAGVVARSGQIARTVLSAS